MVNLDRADRVPSHQDFRSRVESLGARLLIPRKSVDECRCWLYSLSYGGANDAKDVPAITEAGALGSGEPGVTCKPQ